MSQTVITPKNKKSRQISSSVMEQINQGKVKMKPRWNFVLGSVFMIVGLISASVAAFFAMTVAMFMLRQHGPFGELKLQLMLQSFPLWVPVLAMAGIIIGIWLLKKYDFSYKKNFGLIVLLLLGTLLLGAYFFDRLGLNDVLQSKGPMRGIYQNTDHRRGFNDKQKGIKSERSNNEAGHYQ